MNSALLQGVTTRTIAELVGPVREVFGNICGGTDDMRVLGNKALVARATVVQRAMPTLLSALREIGINGIDMTGMVAKGEEIEITLQVTAFTAETDGTVPIPAVPG